MHNSSQKAFIFDMDGVIIASEKEWFKSEGGFFNQLFGEEINKKLGNQTGVSIENTYNKALGLGFSMRKEEYLRRFNEKAKKVFDTAPITPGFEELTKKLSAKGFSLAVVTASPREWVDWALSKTKVADKFQLILSTHGIEEIRHKPYPDGYLAAMKKLGVIPKSTIILEDSTPGILAAKAAGAYTIALTQNLVPGYEQIKDADVTVEKMTDVWNVVSNRIS